MKIIKISAAISLFLGGAIHADTITLNDGKQFEGKVVSEDRTHYTFAVQYTKNISEKRRIAKSDVKKLVLSARDSEAFAEVNKLVPTPDQLKVAGYNQRIKTAREFLTKYPKSTHLKEVLGVLSTLRKEQAVVSAGGMKLDGKLLSASDVKANAYDVHARLILVDVRKLATQRRFQPALRRWEKLQTQYGNSEAYVKSLPFAKKVLAKFLLDTSKQLETLDERTAKKKVGIESLNENDRRRAEQELTNQEKRYTALIDKEEKELKTKWLTVNAYNKHSLEYNKRNAEAEINRLENVNADKITLAGPSYRGAVAALSSNDLEAAAKHIEKLKSLRIPTDYYTPFEVEHAEKVAAEKAAKEKAEQEKMAAEQAAREAAAKKAREEAEAKKKGKKGKGKGKKTPPKPKPPTPAKTPA
ncbi:MAG: PTPDL family protein [Akkermansiaceae bacterium]